MRGLTLWLLCLLCTDGQAEIVFQDFFTGAAGSLTHHTPWIDYHNDGWAAGSNALLDSQGHLVAGGIENASAAFPLLATGPHGMTTATATLHLPPNPPESISIGFNSSVQSLSMDIWAADYLTIRIKDNVSSLAALREEGALVSAYGAFKNLAAPELAIERQGAKWVPRWHGAPAFTPQPRPTLSSSDPGTDLNSQPSVTGPLNIFIMPVTGTNSGFFRSRQNK